jgi:hypothetical protein
MEDAPYFSLQADLEVSTFITMYAPRGNATKYRGLPLPFQTPMPTPTPYAREYYLHGSIPHHAAAVYMPTNYPSKFRICVFELAELSSRAGSRARYQSSLVISYVLNDEWLGPVAWDRFLQDLGLRSILGFADPLRREMDGQLCPGGRCRHDVSRVEFDHFRFGKQLDLGCVFLGCVIC